MNANLNLKISGKYLFRNPDTMEVVKEVKNIITNNGMKRLVGVEDHNLPAFFENLKFLYLGKSGSPEDPNDFKLGNPYTPNPISAWDDSSGIPASEKTYIIRHLADPFFNGANEGELIAQLSEFSGTGMFKWPTDNTSFVANQTHKYSKRPDLVGITYDKTATGDVIVRFTNSWKLKFLTEVVVKEMGVGPFPKEAGQINRYGANPGGINGMNDGDERREAGYNSENAFKHSWEKKGRLDLTDDINYSLFSRAIVSPDAKFNPDDTTVVSYVCEIILCKEAEQLLNFPFNTFGDSSAAMSNRKTMVRQCPFWKMSGLAHFPNNKWHYMGKSGSKHNSQGPIELAPGNFTPIGSGSTSVKEDGSSNSEDFTNNPVVPILDQMYKKQKHFWFMDLHPDTGYLAGGSWNFSSTSLGPTLTADDQFTATSPSEPIPNPIFSSRMVRYQEPGSAPTPNQMPFYIKRLEPISENVFETSPSTWARTIKWQFRTSEWPSGGSLNVYGMAIWRGLSRNQQVPLTFKRQSGIHTFFETPYTPPANKWFQFTLTINYTRA